MKALREIPQGYRVYQAGNRVALSSLLFPA